MRKWFTVATLVVGMALGSVLTMALNPVGAASALVGATPAAKGSHQNVLQQALSTLVGNGTITQSQSNAIQGQVQTDQHAFWATRPPLGRNDWTRVASLIGVDVATLRTDLRSGQTLAQVASAKGINPTTVASQLIAALDNGIDNQVKIHHFTPATAAIMKANLPARVNTFLNRTWGRRLGPRHSHAAVQPATTPSAPATPTPPSTPTTAGTTSTGAGSTTSTAGSGSSNTTGTTQH